MIPLKQYSYDDWLRIAAQNNALRTQSGYSLWSANDVCQLWNALFTRRDA